MLSVFQGHLEGYPAYMQNGVLRDGKPPCWAYREVVAEKAKGLWELSHYRICPFSPDHML